MGTTGEQKRDVDAGNGWGKVKPMSSCIRQNRVRHALLCARRCAALSLCCVVVLGTFAAPTVAQSGAQAEVAGQEEVLSPEARKALLQPSTDDEAYRLGRGDVVSVNVQGRPELTGRQTVGPDGNVTLPLIGSVSVADKTRDEAAAVLREKLLRYYTDPAVTVGVESYTSNQVLLIGAVDHPGPQIYQRQPTLLDVLARGGGSPRTQSSSAQFSGITSGTHALPERAVIYRGGQTAIDVNVAALARGGNTLANLRLMRDDVVYVPSGDDRYISILGQVTHPGAQPLDHDTTLARLLSNAGGLTKEAGANPTLRIVEPSTGNIRLVAFKDLLKPNSTDIALHTGDILYVPESKFNSAAYILDRLSPLVNIFTTAVLLNQR